MSDIIEPEDIKQARAEYFEDSEVTTDQLLEKLRFLTERINDLEDEVY